MVVPASGPLRAAGLRPGVHVAPDAFFDRYGAPLGLAAGDRMVPYGNGGEDLAGLSFRRYRQQHLGVPVFGGEIVLSLRDGLVSYVFGRGIAGLPSGTAPAITARAATEAALQAVAAAERVSVAEIRPSRPPSAELAFVPDPAHSPGHRLGFRVSITAALPIGDQHVDVDAGTGITLAVMSSSVNNWQEMPAFGPSAYNGVVDFLAETDGVGWHLRQGSLFGGIATLDAKGGTDETAADEVTDADGNFDDPFVEVLPGVSVHWATERMLEYLANAFKWQGIANSPGVQLTNLVRYDSNWQNAGFDVWDNKPYTMYGHGQFPEPVDVETVAHEIGHGVVHYSAGLVDWDEPGALNEGFADILAALADFAIEPQTANWTHGEHSKYQRSFDKPDQFCNDGNPVTFCTPDTYGDDGPGPWVEPMSPPTEDMNGVHTNMGVLTYWFYLLSEGTKNVGVNGVGTNDLGWQYKLDGIGKQDAGRLAFDTLTTKLGPSSTYPAAAADSLLAAYELYGEWSKGRIATQNAWHAVGIGAEYAESPYFAPAATGVGVEPAEPWPARLEWEQGANETAWEVQVSTTQDFSSGVQSFPSSDVAPSGGTLVGFKEVELKPGTQYWWRVRKANAPYEAAWRPTHTFATAEKTASLVSPSTTRSGPKYYPWNLAFSWNEVKHASSYTIEVSEDPNFGSYVVPAETVKGLSAKLSVHVDACSGCANPTMYWRVIPNSPENDSDHVGTSDVAAIETTWPQAKPLAPAEDSSVYPWPVTFEWTEVAGAAKYIVEQSANDPQLNSPDDSVEVLPPDKYVPPPNKAELFLKPAELADDQHHHWRVRVIGPEPLSEEGKPSAIWSLVNDGDGTSVVHDKPADGDWVPWDASSMPVTFSWAHVGGATGYVFTIHTTHCGNVCYEVALFEKQLPRDDSDLTHQEYPIDFASEGLNPSDGTDGYTWTVTAVAPNGVEGLNDFNDHAIYILPPDPVVTAPAPDAKAMPFEKNLGMFTFTGEFSPAMYMYVFYEGAGCTGPEFFENWLPSGTGPSYASNGSITFEPNTTYSWRVRPHSLVAFAEAKFAAESWSECRSFTTKLATPEVIHGWNPPADELPIVALAFYPIDGATWYEADVYQVASYEDPTPLSDVLTRVASTEQTEADTEYMATTTADPIPPSGVWMLLSDTDANLDYKYRVRACNEDGCSANTLWWHFGDQPGLPPSP